MSAVRFRPCPFKTELPEKQVVPFLFWPRGRSLPCTDRWRATARANLNGVDFPTSLLLAAMTVVVATPLALLLWNLAAPERWKVRGRPLVDPDPMIRPSAAACMGGTYTAFSSSRSFCCWRDFTGVRLRHSRCPCPRAHLGPSRIVFPSARPHPDRASCWNGVGTFAPPPE